MVLLNDAVAGNKFEAVNTPPNKAGYPPLTVTVTVPAAQASTPLETIGSR